MAGHYPMAAIGAEGLLRLDILFPLGDSYSLFSGRREKNERAMYGFDTNTSHGSYFRGHFFNVLTQAP